jgi:hypothetical protein
MWKITLFDQFLVLLGPIICMFKWGKEIKSKYWNTRTLVLSLCTPHTHTPTPHTRRLTHSLTHSLTHTHTVTRTHTRTHAHTHTHTHTYTHIHIFIHISDIDRLNKANSITKLRDSLIECMNKYISILRGQTFTEKLTIWGRFHKTFFGETYACNLGQNLRQYVQKSFIKLATGTILTTLHFLGNLRMDPISWSVALHLPRNNFQGQTI